MLKRNFKIIAIFRTLKDHNIINLAHISLIQRIFNFVIKNHVIYQSLKYIGLIHCKKKVHISEFYKYDTNCC
jgi:hypothetical protein